MAKYRYKTILINFKEQHSDLFNWVKTYCKENGIGISELIRYLIKKEKEESEKKNG